MTMFVLDPRLAASTLALCQSETSALLVSSDARFPWLILVPKRAGLADLIDLSPADEATVTAEVRGVSQALKNATNCHKLNVASLGNMVRQFHIHVVARFEEDAAWPGPIWGVGEAQPLDALPDWALDVRNQLGWSQ